MEKKEQKYSSTYQKCPTNHEKLKRIRAEIDFANSLPTYYASAWNTTAPRSWNETPTVAKTCHFLRLPAELRVAVYEYALKKPYTIVLHHQERLWAGIQGLEQRLPLAVGPALLRVCNDVRREALPIYFQTNTFILQTPLVALNHAASWLGKITVHGGSNTFGALQFYLRHCHWVDFPRVERLVQLVASGKLKLDVSGIDLSAPVPQQGSHQDGRLFMMHNQNGGMYVQRALEEAVVLGTTASEQQWSAAKASLQLEALMVLKMPLKHLEAHKQTVKSKWKAADTEGRGTKRRKL
jgi:hypothetical protein